MYGDFILLERDEQTSQRIERLAFGDTSGRNEAWLRDTLLAHPEILPIRDIAPSYGPLVPLCREMRTAAGPIDITYINRHGLLTIVECKLWRNPEARRKVVAQVLDYASALSKWSYSDLQREVARATGRVGNVPFELVRAQHPEVQEHTFVDAAAAALARGRFLLLAAGDGIREDVGAMAELLDRNLGSGFSFGLVEVALFGLADGGLVIQPRVIAKTQLLERVVVLPSQSGGRTPFVESVDEPSVPEGSAVQAEGPGAAESPKQAEYRRWWQPVLDMRFDDPDQESPKLYWPNHVRAALPWPQTWLTAYRYGDRIGVGTGGREEAVNALTEKLGDQAVAALAELPPGTELKRSQLHNYMCYSVTRPVAELGNDDGVCAWVISTLNTFANVLRPKVEAAFKNK